MASSWFSARLLLKCFLALSVLPFLGLLGAIGLFWHFSAEVPPLDDLRSITPTLSTEVFDKDGKPFGEFFVERRNWVSLDSIPTDLQNAVVSIEDRRFWSHWGMNLWRTAGAAVSVLRGHRQGGSTITQQLARNVFLTQQKTYSRKIKEAITSVMLERYYTKRQLITYYLNEVYLGSGAYGMQAAARIYFGKDVWKLDRSECATLAGLIQLPETYRPDRNPRAAEKRRNRVLAAMADEGYITQEQLEETLARRVKARPWKRANSDGAYYLEIVRHHIEKTYGEEALYHGGLSVHLPVDRRIQLAADSAVLRWTWNVQRSVNKRMVRKLKFAARFNLPDSLAAEKFDSLFSIWLKETGRKTWKDSAEYADTIEYYTVQAAAIVIENSTGEVRALVGGRSFDNSKFNRAIQASRQAGSTFKPFVYASAIEKGALPSDVMLDDTLAIDDGSGQVWMPHNYDNRYEGPVTLRRALMLSKNMPAIQVAIRYGMKNVIDLARRAGIKSPLPGVYSLALGSADVTLLEMTSAYSSFANLGTRMEPRMWDSITAHDGTVLERTLRRSYKVMDSAPAYVAVDMMRDVVRHGTGYPAIRAGFTFPAGGKTGTTNDYTDAWFIGYTPIYTCGVWMGFDQKKKLGSGFTGGSVALPIWIDIMKEAHRAIPPREWPRPRDVVTFNSCGKPQADGTCAQERPEFAVRGNPNIGTSPYLPGPTPRSPSVTTETPVAPTPGAPVAPGTTKRPLLF
ncbi:MAG: PBP1A family penicillin-binding protein [Fibrobacteria bacterium]|nr:PBP1A family penicillin-binding protein [Fibrobacteria bacterium]